MGKYKNNNRICRRNNSITKKKSPKYEWRDEECIQAITRMTIARMKGLQQNTRANQKQERSI